MIWADICTFRVGLYYRNTSRDQRRKENGVINNERIMCFDANKFTPRVPRCAPGSLAQSAVGQICNLTAIQGVLVRSPARSHNFHTRIADFLPTRIADSVHEIIVLIT